MIQIKRLKAPHQLTRSAPKWTQDLLHAIQLQKQGQIKKVSDKLWDKYRKNYVKETLERMFYKKCAYCESNISHAADLHIEHYRPKSKYPDLTFQWHNLLLGCPICNNHKGNKFPLFADDETKPLLLNPCDDDVTAHLEFEQARIVAKSERGQVTCDLLALNRDDLFDERRERYLWIDFLRRSLNQDSNNSAIQLWLDKFQTDEAEFVGMVRASMAKPLSITPPL